MRWVLFLGCGAALLWYMKREQDYAQEKRGELELQNRVLQDTLGELIPPQPNELGGTF